MKGEGLVLRGWSWSDGEGATIIAHPRERPGMITMIITCIIPGSVLDILDILLNRHKALLGIAVYFTDENIEAHGG